MVLIQTPSALTGALTSLDGFQSQTQLQQPNAMFLEAQETCRPQMVISRSSCLYQAARYNTVANISEEAALTFQGSGFLQLKKTDRVESKETAPIFRENFLVLFGGCLESREPTGQNSATGPNKNPIMLNATHIHSQLWCFQPESNI